MILVITGKHYLEQRLKSKELLKILNEKYYKIERKSNSIGHISRKDCQAISIIEGKEDEEDVV